MGKVIKRTDAEVGDIPSDTGLADMLPRRHPVITRDTAEARSEAQQIREQALAAAAETRRQADLDAERIKAGAYELGFEEGKNAAATQLCEIVASTSRRLKQIEEQVEPQLRELAIKIARRVLGKELEFHPDAVVDIVRQALSEKARQRREISLRVHPDDLQYIREHKYQLLEVLSRTKEIAIREDPEVQRHGVIIETDAGIIDAQLDTQLAVFERLLRDMG